MSRTNTNRTKNQRSTLHQLLMAEFAKVPALALRKLIADKLEEQGVKAPEDFVEEIATRIMSGSGDSIEWDDGSDETRNLRLTFTDKDAAKLEESVGKFMEELPDTIRTMADESARHILRSLKKDWPQQALYDGASFQGFQERLLEEWGDALALLRMLHTIGLEMGEEMHTRAARSKSKKNRAMRNVLIKLHARSCQIVGEILALMESGFADGAMARWRTLYEIGVVAAVIAEAGDAAALSYLEHEVVESKFAMDEYDACHLSLGFNAIAPRQRHSVERAFASAIQKHGDAFGKPYGWAANQLKKKRVTFRDLEDAAQRSFMRSYYKMASYNVHADVKGISFRLGLLDEQHGILAGASNVGLEEPGQNTAIAFTQITGLLFNERINNFDAMVRLSVMVLLRDEIVAAFMRSHRQIKRTHKKMVQKKVEKAQGNGKTRRK